MTLVAVIYIHAQQASSTSFGFINSFYDNLYRFTYSLMEATWFFPLKGIWGFILSHTLFGYLELGKIRIIVLSFLGIFLGDKLTAGYRRAKKDNAVLEKKVQQELDLELKRREKGLSNSEVPLHSVRVSIQKKYEFSNRKKVWDETWWGRIIIGLAIIALSKLLLLN